MNFNDFFFRYLYIGYVKAVLLNYYYREIFKGIFIMRFDDINLVKENAEFEQVQCMIYLVFYIDIINIIYFD